MKNCTRVEGFSYLLVLGILVLTVSGFGIAFSLHPKSCGDDATPEQKACGPSWQRVR